MTASIQDQRRERFEQAVIARMKESGYLEVEIRVECLARSGPGYYDGSVDAYWHFWNEALDGVVVELPTPFDTTNCAATSADYDRGLAHGQCQARNDYKAAVEAAGLKVLP